MGLAPIAVMSFRRPDKLDGVLASLKAQTGCEIERREVHLFQDNAVNRYSRMRYAEDAQVAECVEVFKRQFPEGRVHLADGNIGVCENFERAENFLFDELKADCAYFFEDDLVLSPAYVRMLDLMQHKAQQSGNIAYFACYGDYYAPPSLQEDRARAIIPLDHHWGFGLFGRHRAAIRKAIQPYLDIVMGNDYTRRNHRAVYDMYAALGSCPRGSSQDAAKAHACARLGLWRCNTAMPFARYTGDVGAHMDKELFDKIGFSRVTAQETPITDLAWPSKPEVRGYIEEQRALFRRIAETEIDDLRRGLGRYLNPMRLCTQTDIDYAYRLLLHREPESDDIYQRHAGKTPVAVYVRSIMNSQEFKNLPERKFDPALQLDPVRPCTAEDIVVAYHLLMHREAENDAIFERQVGKTAVWNFCTTLMVSDEFKKIWSKINP
ncbi:hypothetical protein [Bradyrhizobium sp. HKCCYLS20291]|uniref:hypothetical protein n=1 Tax=Bradyrhizobium sp. HKCCYLS20291 TaxID=3420766 RepID=UPI003EBC20BE